MNPAVWINGQPANGLSPDDRGLAYGDGVFETLALDAGRPWFWQAHMDRLTEGCDRLGLAAPPQEILLREVRELASRRDRCVAKIIVTRGPGGRGYAPASDAKPTRVVSIHPYPAGVDDLARDGVHARVLSLRLAIQPALGGIKHLNRLEQVLAAAELEGSGAQEGVLLDAEGHVNSSVHANLFLVSGRRLLTPRMDRCGVRGVLRTLILREFKPRCEMRRITPDMLAEADEAFLCNAVRGVIPLLGIDATTWPAGPVTRELQAWFHEKVMSA